MGTPGSAGTAAPRTPGTVLPFRCVPRADAPRGRFSRSGAHPAHPGDGSPVPRTPGHPGDGSPVPGTLRTPGTRSLLPNFLVKSKPGFVRLMEFQSISFNQLRGINLLQGFCNYPD